MPDANYSKKIIIIRYSLQTSADWFKNRKKYQLKCYIQGHFESSSINQMTFPLNTGRRPKSQKSDIIFLGKQRKWMKMFKDVQPRDRGNDETQNTLARSEQQFQMLYAITLVIWS